MASYGDSFFLRVKCALVLNLLKHDVTSDILGPRMYTFTFFDLGT
jgi:hypothetical protein